MDCRDVISSGAIKLQFTKLNSRSESADLAIGRVFALALSLRTARVLGRS
jgi:hypothetical protein